MHQFFEHLQPLMFDHKQFNENINIMPIDDNISRHVASNRERMGLGENFQHPHNNKLSKQKTSIDFDQTPFNSQTTPTR